MLLYFINIINDWPIQSHFKCTATEKRRKWKTISYLFLSSNCVLLWRTTLWTTGWLVGWRPASSSWVSRSTASHSPSPQLPPTASTTRNRFFTFVVFLILCSANRKQPACTFYFSEPVFVNLLRSPGIDFQPGGAGTTALFVILTRQVT